MRLHEQDFLMRQVQYMTQLLQQILFKKSQNRKQEAKDEIENALNRLSESTPKEFSELSPEETLQIFTINNSYKSELALAAADLLIQKGEMMEETSFSKAQKSYAQALLLLKRTLKDPEAAVPLDIRQKVRTVETQIADPDQLQKIDRIADE